MKVNGFFMIGALIAGLVVGYFVFHKAPTTISDTTPVTIEQDLPPEDSTHKAEIIYRDTTIYKDSIVYKIKWKDRIIEVPIPVDSAAIIQDYLTIKHYSFDTTANEVTVHEETALFANRILNRTFVLTNNRKCEETSINGFSLGLIGGYHEFSVLAGYTHNQSTYLAGYNLYEKQFKVGILIKPFKYFKSWKKRN